MGCKLDFRLDVDPLGTDRTLEERLVLEPNDGFRRQDRAKDDRPFTEDDITVVVGVIELHKRGHRFRRHLHAHLVVELQA